MGNFSVEIFGDGLAEVGEGGAGAEVGGGVGGGRVGEEGDVFAGVVGGGVDGGGVAAVVGGEEEEVVGGEGGEEGGEEGVELFERAGEAFDVFAMAVEHVEVDEVGEDEAGGAVGEGVEDFGHAVGIIFGGDVVADAAAVVDVVNFSDAEDGDAAVFEDVEEHGARRLDGVVVAAFGAAEISGLAGEGASDDAADAVGSVEKAAGDFTHFVELGDGDDVFMGGDLEDAVAGSVDDGKAGADVFGAKFLKNFGSGGRLIPQCLTADLRFEGVDDFGRKAVRVDGKGLVEPDAGHFPVAGGGVLAGGVGGGFAETRERRRGRSEVGEGFDVGEAEFGEIGKREGAGGGDVAEGVATDVAVIGGVGEFADADAVEDDPDDAREFGSGVWIVHAREVRREMLKSGRWGVKWVGRARRQREC